MELKEPHNGRLSKEEIIAIIKDDNFQKSLKMFSTPKFHYFFRAFGFSIAVAAGLFGYYLKADSEADSRKAETVQRVISENKEWMIKTLNAVIALRRIRFEIELECKYKKPLTEYQEAIKRYSAREARIKAFSGITEVFDQEVLNAFLDLTKFDESIPDICAKNAPSDDEWRKRQIKLTILMRDSIQQDRQELKKLENNFFSKI